MDNQEAVKIGDLERYMEVLKVIRPQVEQDDVPRSVRQEKVDELTLRAGESEMQRAFIDTTNVEDRRWEPPSGDEDCRGVCEAIYLGVEQAEWQCVYYKFVETNNEINICSPGWEQDGEAAL